MSLTLTGLVMSETIPHRMRNPIALWPSCALSSSDSPTGKHRTLRSEEWRKTEQDGFRRVITPRNAGPLHFLCT